MHSGDVVDLQDMSECTTLSVDDRRSNVQMLIR